MQYLKLGTHPLAQSLSLPSVKLYVLQELQVCKSPYETQAHYLLLF